MNKVSKTLDLMIKHNKNVDINNFFLKHLGFSWDFSINLLGPKKICQNHLEENCIQCGKK